jgi:hypothetical protein
MARFGMTAITVGGLAFELSAGVIAAGRHSPSLLAELEKRERRLEEISDELLATDGRGIDDRLKEIEAFVLDGLEKIQGRLAGKIPRAKAELAKHCTEITLAPEGDTSSVVSGICWAMYVRMVPEARIEHNSLCIAFRLEVAA